MKRILILLLLLYFIIMSSFAQMNDIKFGVKSGMTIGNINFSAELPSNIDEKFKTGFVAGGMMVLPLNEKMSIQGELLYVMKGETLEINDGLYKLPFNMHGFELPVLFKYLVAENIHLYGGLSMTYITAATLEGSDLLENDRIKRFGYGISAGGQYIIEKLILDLRFDLGLSDYQDGDFIVPEDETMKLNTLYLTIGYLF